MSNDFVDSLVDGDDFDLLQAKLVRAATENDEIVLPKLQTIRDGLEEPYRTVASVIQKLKESNKPINASALKKELSSRKLFQATPNAAKSISTKEVINLITTTEYKKNESAQLVQEIEDVISEKKLNEAKSAIKELVDDKDIPIPELLQKLDGITKKAKMDHLSSQSEQPNELDEFVPFTIKLLSKQTGSKFQGLDSGFNIVNSICNGLDTGLTVIGAPPGTGKTTWMWQVCCQVAALNQTPVIFVSMEQSKDELRAKAIARLSKIDYGHLLRGGFDKDDPDQITMLFEGLDAYSSFCSNITIVEGDRSTTTDKILDIALSKQVPGKRCLVAIDYIQKLPASDKDLKRAGSSKENIDGIVSDLRRMARELDSPVMAISSQNRASYNTKVLSAFKESGEIEYSADIAIMLSSEKTTEGSLNSDGFREVHLNIIKNRNGELGAVEYKFYPKFASFTEVKKVPLVQSFDDQ